MTTSQQVAWWPVHEFIAAIVANVTELPYPGTPAWCELADGDPRKLLALAAAGEHHILRVETAQEARAEASKAIAAATNWPQVARNHHRHANAVASGAYIERRAS